MTKKEWQEHCKWLDTFRGKILTSNINPNETQYKKYIREKKSKKEKKD